MRPIHRIVFRTGLSLGIAGVLLALWLVGAALWFASPPPPPARAQGMGQITHTTVADFTAPCVISMNISVANTDGGELRLVASVEDYFDGTSLDTTRWITNISNPQAGSYQSLIMGSGLITLDGVYLRSVLTMTQVPMFFETRARLMQSANTSGSPDLGFYREIGPLYNPNTMSSSIRLFVLGNGDPNDLIVRARDDGGEMIDRNIPDPDKTQFHIFRIEWEEGQTRYLIDGQPQETITINTTVITSWVFLYHQTPSFYGSTPTDIDWVRAGQYALNGIFTSCPQDAGQKVQWTTLSWDADTPAGTTVTFRVRTSMDGTTWSDWSNPLPSNPNNIPPSLAFARYLQYRVEMSTTSPMFSPEVRQIVLRSTELADLTVSKEASASTVLAGTELTYTVRVTNNGPLNATNVRVTDTLPAGVTLSDVSTSQGSCSGPVCDLGTLNAGATALLTLRVRVNSNTPAGQLTNTVVASTSNPDDPANNTASITTQVQTQADLALTISDSPDPVIAGTPLTYTVLVTNNGPSDAQAVQVGFTFPTALTLLGFSSSQGTCSGTNCTLGTLTAGATAQITITARVNSNTPEGPLATQATATSPTTDPNAANNTATASTQVQTQADLALTINDSPDPVIAGNPLTYTIVLANGGPSDAQAAQVALSLNDGLLLLNAIASQGTCSNTICNLGTLTAGATARITVTARVNSSLPAGTTLTSIATASTSTPDPDPANNTATAYTSVQTRADLALTISDSPDPVIAGNPLTYTVLVTNNGPSDAQAVQVGFTFPTALTSLSFASSQGTCSGTSCTLGTLTAGATAQITITARVNSNTPEGPLATQATATSPTTDPNAANNTATASTQVQTWADLALTISDSPDPVIAGTPLTYTVLVTNNGPSDAWNIWLTVTIPSEVDLIDFSPSTCSRSGNQIRCHRAELPANNDFTLNVTVTVPSDVPGGTLLIAQADVSSDVADPDVEDNTTIASTEVTLEADLQAYLVGDPNLVFVGEVITYTLTLTNTGPSTASRVTATLSIPSGLSVIDVQPSQGSCTGTECDLGSLAVEGSATVRWWVRVMQWPGSLISVRATVQSEAEDPNPEDNSPAISTAVRLRVFLPLVYR